MLVAAPSSSSDPILSSSEPKNHEPLYGPLERIFRAAYFQFAVQKAGWIEQFLIWVYRGSETKKFCFVPHFDGKRMDNTLESLKAIGGTEFYVHPPGAKIHMMVFTAQALEAKLNFFGARWVKEGKQYIITPPSSPTPEWDSFKKVLLQKTGWQETERGIVTCDNANLVDGKQKQCFLHIYYPFIRLGSPKVSSRLGFYLGMKQDCCFYDPRGTRKSLGTPSEKGFYLDAVAVMEKLKGGYAVSNIWVSGSCKTAPIAAYIKAKYHSQGIHCAVEQAWVDLQSEMLNKQSWIPRKFAEWNLSALECRDKVTKDAAGPVEDKFNTRRKWEALPRNNGKVVTIYTPTDKTVPAGAHDRFHQLASQVSHKAHSLSFTAPPGKDGHIISCLSDPNFVRRFTEVIFSDVSSSGFYLPFLS
jgi:hypothetical protein